MYVINSFPQLQRFGPRLCCYLFCFHITLSGQAELLALEFPEVITHLSVLQRWTNLGRISHGGVSLLFDLESSDWRKPALNHSWQGGNQLYWSLLFFKGPRPFLAMSFSEFMMSSWRWLSGCSFESLVPFLKPAISQPVSRESKPVIHPEPPAFIYVSLLGGRWYFLEFKCVCVLVTEREKIPAKGSLSISRGKGQRKANWA